MTFRFADLMIAEVRLLVLCAGLVLRLPLPPYVEWLERSVLLGVGKVTGVAVWH